jgi:hypothetical protein
MCHVHETACFFADGEPGEDPPVPEYYLRLGELPDGRWLVNLMEIPWSSNEIEQDFPTVAEACAKADALYRIGTDRGTWRVTQWGGWERP